MKPVATGSGYPTCFGDHHRLHAGEWNPTPLILRQKLKSLEAVDPFEDLLLDNISDLDAASQPANISTVEHSYSAHHTQAAASMPPHLEYPLPASSYPAYTAAIPSHLRYPLQASLYPA